ncbi:MAG: hypothetical protein ACOZQL_21620 [Myxococcota bacterium]
MRLALVLLLLVGALAGCSSGADVARASTSPSVPQSRLALTSQTGCLVDSDCRAGLFCAQNACTFECGADLPCAMSETCSDRGRCIIAASDERTGVRGLEDEALAAVVPTTQPTVTVATGLPLELQVPAGAPFVEATLTTTAPVAEGAISYRVVLDGQSTTAQTLRAVGSTSFTLSIPTGRAGTLDAPPDVQQVNVITSVGGYTVSLVPRRSVDGVYAAGIAVREFGGSEVPLRFALRVEPQGATWAEATSRFLLLPVSRQVLFSPAAPVGNDETWVERPLEWDAEGRVWFARFSSPWNMAGDSLFASARNVARSLRVELRGEEDGRFTGAIADRWQGLFATRSADGVQSPGSVALAGTFTATRNGPLPVAARTAVTGSGTVPTPALGAPIALSDCSDALWTTMIQATSVTGDAGVSNPSCPGLLTPADFALAPPDVRAECALRLSAFALAGPTTGAQVRAFLDESQPDPGGLTFAEFLERCAAQDGYCVPTPEVRCSTQLLAFAYQTQGAELQRAGALLSAFQTGARETYLGRQLAAFQVDTSTRLEWLRTSEAPLFLAAELKSYNEDLLTKWKAQVLDAHFAVLSTQFAPAALEVLGRQPTDATAISVRNQMLLEQTQSWQGAMDALQIAAQRWNALYQDDTNRARTSALVRTRSFDLYLTAAVLSQLNRAAGTSAFSSVFGSGFSSLMRSQEELALPFNERLFMRDAEVVVSRSVDPTGSSNTLLADREELARTAVADAQASVDRVLADARAEQINAQVLTDRLLTQTQELQSELVELCGLPTGCTTADVNARPECTVNVKIGGCGFAIDPVSSAYASFDALQASPSISQAGQAVLAYRQSLIEYQSAAEEFRGNQEKAAILLATADAFAARVTAWDERRRAVGTEVDQLVEEIGQLRADAYTTELQTLRQIQQRRRAAYEVQAGNVANWATIRNEGVTADMKKLTSITALQQSGAWLTWTANEIDHLAEVVKEGYPKAAGAANDFTAPARFAIGLAAYGGSAALRGVQRALESAAAGVQLSLEEEQARRSAQLENLADLASLAQMQTENEIADMAGALRAQQARSDLEIATREALIDALRRNLELDLAHERDLVELRDRRDQARLLLVESAHLRTEVLRQEVASSRKLLEYFQIVQRAQLLQGRSVALQSRLQNLESLLGSPAVIFAFANRLARAESRVERARTLLYDWLVALEYYAVRPFVDQRLAVMLARNPSQLEAIANELVRLEGACGGIVNTAVTELSLRDDLLGVGFDTESQTAAERFRAVLARGNVPIDTQVRYSSDLRVGQLLSSRKVLAASFTLRLDQFANLPLSCNAKVASVDVALVGEGLGRARPVVSILYDGTSTLRSCQPNVDAVVAALDPGSTSFGSLTRLRTRGRSISPLAGINDFGAEDSANRGLEGLPLASTYTVLIDPTAGENARLDWSKLDDVRLKLTWAYQDVFPEGQCQ